MICKFLHLCFCKNLFVGFWRFAVNKVLDLGIHGYPFQNGAYTPNYNSNTCLHHLCVSEVSAQYFLVISEYSIAGNYVIAMIDFIIFPKVMNPSKIRDEICIRSWTGFSAEFPSAKIWFSNFLNRGGNARYFFMTFQ